MANQYVGPKMTRKRHQREDKALRSCVYIAPVGHKLNFAGGSMKTKLLDKAMQYVTPYSVLALYTAGTHAVGLGFWELPEYLRILWIGSALCLLFMSCGKSGIKKGA